MKSKNWFEVSRQGLKTLQAGKPKHHIVRELIQNAWDENITYCEVSLVYAKGEVQIKVVDDSLEGFRDLADAYTLFKETQKRPDPTKRGRFNVGEKQAIALSEKAKITTTKGTIIFDKTGRRNSRKNRSIGSEVILWVKMSEIEFNEIYDMLERYIAPKGIKFTIDGSLYQSRITEKRIQTSLKTEIEEYGMMKQTYRKTEIFIYKRTYNLAMLYEMGIPICEIDCQFDIDIQQRVPLSIDRETVPEKYLSDIYAEVLNETSKEIEKENSSNLWIREAMSNKRIKPEVVKEIVEKRFGKKSCVANPFDPNSIDEGISRGYNMVYGSELSHKEWENIKESGALPSSTQLFGKDFVGAESIKPTEAMLKVKDFAQRIAKRLLKFKLRVNFVKSKASCGANYTPNCLIFNVSQLSKSFWDYPFQEETISLILHELAHSKGNHTEMNYHECLSEMAGKLVVIALEEPDFF